MPTMLLPMSWTSPFTVASTIRSRGPLAASDSMYGSRTATAFFITRALLTTWGRNILPSPKRSPTTRMPSMRGPSITARAEGIPRRASSASRSTWSMMPFTTAWASRSATGRRRHASSAAAPFRPAPARSAIARSRSVASPRRARTTSSTRSRSVASISS